MLKMYRKSKHAHHDNLPSIVNDLGSQQEAGGEAGAAHGAGVAALQGPCLGAATGRQPYAPGHRRSLVHINQHPHAFFGERTVHLDA